MALNLGMEYQRHYSSTGWDFNRGTSAPSINNMLSTIRRASDLPAYENQQWRSGWDASRPPISQAMEHERSASFTSPAESKDSRSQRLPSLRSILNSPPPAARPSQTSAPSQSELPPNGVPRSSSPQFFREDVASANAHRMSTGTSRNDSVTASTPTGHGYPNAPPYYHDGHAQHGPMHDPHMQKLSIQTQHTVPLVAAPAHQRTPSASQASALSMQSDKMGNPDDLSDIPRNALKRRSEAPRGPPRITKCVGQKDVPGEGICWFYEDGSYCRTVIDGERVNPNWGVTKAGRPRKRLAQACLTCREKKIKCEPAYPKCHQCAKSQRVCKGGMSQYMGTDGPPDTPTGPRDSSAGSNNAGSPVDRSSANSVNEPMSAADSSDSPKSAKRARTFSISSGKGYFDYPGSANTAITPGSELVDPLDRDAHPLSLGWERDPYEADPKHTLQLLDLYFTHIASATYCMFPKSQFLTWVENCKTKSQDDRMLLYSVLAMGSTFAMDHMLRALGKHLGEIASHALERRVGKFTLQLCQARLLIALYQWSQGKAGETIAWDMSASAFRAISALSLNTEKGISNFDDDDLTFGFDRPTLEECRRRTFWSGFLMDRYNGFCGGTMCVFNHDDIFLRLPCRESEFERLDSVEPRPFFDYDALLKSEPGSSPTASGGMAQLVLVSAIWGDVFSTTSRAVHRAESPSYPSTYQEFREKTARRLQNWLEGLPAHFRYSPENLDKSIAHGYAGTFVSLHALYHTSHIRLNRYMRHSALPTPTVVGCVQAARYHSRSLLSMMQDLSRVSRSARFSMSEPYNQIAKDFSFSTPFPGYAFMNAVDVLSAGGLLSSLPGLISIITVGLSCVEELAEYWSSGKAQLKALRTRVKLLGDVATGEKPEHVVHSPTFEGNEKGWRLKSGLEPSFEKEDDSLYGTGSSEAFWEGVLKDADTTKAA